MTLLEIYMDKIRDLLAKKKKGEVRGKGPGLKIKKGPDGNYVENITTVEVSSRAQLEHHWAFGMKNRSTASTKMNDQSSRSHCMLSVYLTCKNKLSGKTLKGKLHLIDLAGSERLNKSKVTGDAKKEAVAINKSLTCLGDVIFARANKSAHVPYRNSKLTYCLEDSLAGDSKTMMIAQISPADYNSGESYCTMAFANRVQKVELGKAKAHGGEGGDDDH
jgi:kinesin family protein C2/C3